MKVTLLCFVSLILCISCKEDVYESVQIVVQNRTEDSIHITLYPKSEYVSGNLYRRSEKGGGYTRTEYTLPPNNDGYYNWSEVLFVSNDLDSKPYDVTRKVFDSIYIRLENTDYVIRFSQDTVIGYVENIFSEHATWHNIIIEDELPTNFKRNPQKYHCYRFLIVEDFFSL